MLPAILVVLLMATTPAGAKMTQQEWTCRGEAVKAVRIEYEPTAPFTLRNGQAVTGKKMTRATRLAFDRHVRHCMCRGQPWWHLCHWPQDAP